MVQAILSQCYDTVNIEFDNSAVEAYLHAFTATAVDGDVPLTSTTDGYFLIERTTGTH